MEETSEFISRPYQIDLFEKCLTNNSIVYLPTGSGKTFIAVLLIKSLSGDVQKTFSNGGKRSVFLVNTVILVHQQAKYLSRHTGLKCKGFSGDMQTDFWSDNVWKEEIEENQVLIMTAQILLNIINHGILGLHRINLIIFDECHKAVGEHAMRVIMRSFQNCPVSEQPRVVGLSGSLLNGNVKVDSIESVLRTLEITFHAKIESIENQSSVTEYMTNPNESKVFYDEPENNSILDEINAVVNNLQEILKKIHIETIYQQSSENFQPKTKIHKLINHMEEVRYNIQNLGMYGGTKMILLKLILFEKAKKYIDNQQQLLIIDCIITQLTKMLKVIELKISDQDTELQHLYKYSSPKMLKLFEILKKAHKELEGDQKFCCLIFVQERSVAQAIYHVLKKLKELDENFNFLKPDYLAGFNNDPFKNSRELLCTMKWSSEVLTKFRNGQVNCIVTTDVLEEGIDIQSCSLVIRYYEPQDFRSYVQSKGRARHRTSQYIILVSNQDSCFLEKLDNFHKINDYLKRFLSNSTANRVKPTLTEIDDMLYNYDIPSYEVFNSSGCVCTLPASGAIQVINEYCINLSRSKFVRLTPIWVLKRHDDKSYQVALTLPIVSPLTETILGQKMPSISAAKRSAAMQTCIALHQMGELEDTLIPKSGKMLLKDVDYLFPNWEEEDALQIQQTRKVIRQKKKHKIIYPETLYGAYPQSKVPLFLHVLDVKPTYPAPHDNRHLVFYKLLSQRGGFGILSTKSMPLIPSFPLYMNVGELNVTIHPNHKCFSLPPKDIENLKTFHSIIFSQVLGLIKDFMVFDTDNLENSFLIVPLSEGWDVDWEVISKYPIVKHIIPEKPFEMKRIDYELSLVTPSYRASSVYIITEVCDDLQANSCFPTEDFHSYLHYFKERHGLTVTNPRQSMLEVKPVSKKINFIKPRGVSVHLSERKRADLMDDSEEHFVPELCNKVSFPAVLWLKATYLPSLLHRLNQFLIAEELRVQIATEMELPEDLIRGKKWDPFVIGDVSLSEETDDQELDNTIEEYRDTLEECVMDNIVSGSDVDVLEPQLYSWKKEQEPADLIRNADTIGHVEIEHYYQFMKGATTQDKEILRNGKGGIEYQSKHVVSVPSLNIFSPDPNGPSPCDIMQALTAKMSNDVINLERLETLGDSFLKFAVTLFLYETFPEFREGYLTTIKSRIIGNRNLRYCGIKRLIPGRMKVDAFDTKSNFIAPAYVTERRLQKVLVDLEISPSVLFELHIPSTERFDGKITRETWDAIETTVLQREEETSQTGMEHFVTQQMIADKSIADCVEALIGVYLVKLSIETTGNLLKWFGILPENVDINTGLFGPTRDAMLGEGDPNFFMPWAEKFETKLGYKFKNRAFLLQAFTHPSYSSNRMTASYERLELLGDAILDFLITSYIYENCGMLSPGALTDLRSALVNNITFACLTVKYGLHTSMLAYDPLLNEAIDRFVKFQEERNFVIDDELLWILCEEDECLMAEHVDVPKCLGDIFESLIGAIYLDSGKDLQLVWSIVYSLMVNEIVSFSNNVPMQPLKVLYDTQGTQPTFSKHMPLENTSVLLVTLSATINGERRQFNGFGKTKKQAKTAAAKLALKSLRYKK